MGGLRFFHHLHSFLLRHPMRPPPPISIIPPVHPIPTLSRSCSNIAKPSFRTDGTIPWPPSLLPDTPSSFTEPSKTQISGQVLAGLKNKNTTENRVIELSPGSQVIYFPKFLLKSTEWFDKLNHQLPWIRPNIHVFGRTCLQPRDVCYVANPGLPNLVYGGYKPDTYSWNDFPCLQELLDLVHSALPGTTFNSVLVNRYNNGNDYVSWHSDNEWIYGPTPEIASISLGCERDFVLKKKLPSASSKKARQDEPASKLLKTSSDTEKHLLALKDGSLLVMKGYTQRDWLHTVPKRAKAGGVRINLTFRHVL